MVTLSTTSASATDLAVGARPLDQRGCLLRDRVPGAHRRVRSVRDRRRSWSSASPRPRMPTRTLTWPLCPRRPPGGRRDHRRASPTCTRRGALPRGRRAPAPLRPRCLPARRGSPRRRRRRRGPHYIAHAAERAALIIRRALLLEREQHVASTLQHDLLPHSLPELPGVEPRGALSARAATASRRRRRLVRRRPAPRRPPRARDRRRRGPRPHRRRDDGPGPDGPARVRPSGPLAARRHARRPPARRHRARSPRWSPSSISSSTRPRAASA